MTDTRIAPAVETLPASVQAVLGTVAQLRNPEGGCPWDLKQDHATLRPYLLEEAYELLDVLNAYAARKASAAEDLAPWGVMKEELGDVLLQVLLHSQIAEDHDRFSFGDVCATLNEKLIRRHPHVFGEAADLSPEGVSAQWQQIKAAEKGEDGTGPTSILAGVKPGQAALMFARDVSQKAVKAGFDWPNWASLFDCVRSELDELAAEVTDATPDAAQRDRQEEELGDLLFAVASVAGRLKVCPEVALRRATEKFTRRFEAMEALHQQQSGEQPIRELTLEAWDALWREAKAVTASPS